MHKYHHSKPDDINDMDRINILQILNDFVHLINKHDNDEQFEFISNRLGFCDITKCKIFWRNNRNLFRSDLNSNVIELKSNNSNNSNPIYSEILSKIHCYYQHCYDVGNRVLMQDKEMINNNIDEQITINNESTFSSYITNKKVMKISKLLSSKREICANICIRNRLNSITYQKYSQLFATDTHDNGSNEEMYHFGFKFDYGMDDHEEKVLGATDSIHVFVKYSTLKEEMISNNICVMQINQFDMEYKKAIIHFNSDYRKTHLHTPQNTYTDNKDMMKLNKLKMKQEFHIGYVLALMIYCNYDALQYEFSKTYRIQNGSLHSNFYHLGKYLKESVHIFGTRIYEGDVKSFYHGISQRLCFPNYVRGEPSYRLRIGINISCPLSTSSSFAVATNFSNNNNGLIIKFGKPFNSHCKYFAVSWLSDYGNESEYLFIQNNNKYRRLDIVDIFDVKYGYQYGVILQSLRNIDLMMNDPAFTHHHYNWFSIYVRNPQWPLIKAIISNELSYKIPKYQSEITLNSYAKTICGTFFNNRKWITMDYLKCKKKHFALFEMLFDLKCEFINLNLIHILFPNIEFINIHNINLCAITVQYILDYFSQKNTKQKIKRIKIVVNTGSQLSVQKAINTYYQTFRKMNIYICGYIRELNFVFNKLDFALLLIRRMGQYYFEDENKEITNIIDSLLQPQSANTNDIEYVVSTQRFKEYSNTQTEFFINWTAIRLNPHLGPFKLLYHSDHEWIKINILSSILENLKKLEIDNIHLNEAIFDVILKESNIKSNLKRIVIRPHKDNNFSIRNAIKRYNHTFRKSNLFIYGDLCKNKLYFDLNVTHLDFVFHLIKSMGCCYFEDINDETTNLMNRLIQKQLQCADSSVNDTHYHVIQQLLNQYCINRTVFTVDWKQIIANRNSRAFKLFYQSKYEWVKMRIFTKFFPNLKTLKILHIKMSILILDHILKYLSTNNTSTLRRVEICNPNKESDISLLFAVSTYKHQFNAINFDIKIHRMNDRRLCIYQRTGYNAISQ